MINLILMYLNDYNILEDYSDNFYELHGIIYYEEPGLYYFNDEITYNLYNYRSYMNKSVIKSIYKVGICNLSKSYWKCNII